MGKVFLFPGQGSQKVGMGSDFLEKFDSVRARFEEASIVLGFDLAKLCVEGPQEELTQTRNTQPALFTIENAICEVLVSQGVKPVVTLGHSLGEYSALCAAGFFSFADGVKIVAKRGALMAEAGKKAPGTMAAVIGMSPEAIGEVLGGLDVGIVVPANENTPVQTVISGEIAAVEAAGEKLKEAGAKRVLPLPVSGAFHSPLMQQAADEFAEFLEGFAFATPACPVVSNVTAQEETDPQKVKELLIKQLVSPVRWVASMAYIKAKNMVDCIEVGPGSVLKGLGSKCDRDINVVSCDTVDNLYSVAQL